MTKIEMSAASKFDENMKSNDTISENIAWHSPMQQPFHVAGLNWFEQEKKYGRLPSNIDLDLPEAVIHLARHTAGGQIRFKTDSTFLYVKVKLIGPAHLVHMPATGQCGVDCYIGEPGEMEFCRVSLFELNASEYESPLFSGWNREMRNVVLNLPLYQGVEEVWIGLDEEAAIAAPPPYKSNKKVVIYGTSITQGGCASRPGMMYSNILSRRIPYEFINLGFSGNGKGEPEVAHMISRVENPALIVIDYEGNCVSTALFRETLPQFVAICRQAHPLTPILIQSRIKYSRENLTSHLEEWRNERKEIEQNLVDKLRAEGDNLIFFNDGSNLLGERDFHECTVDGTHPTDLGFLRMAEGLEPVYRALLS